MSYKDDGGPAFPSHGSMGEVVQNGLSLRDYFAASAGGQCPHNQHEHDKCAQWAFERADAMIAERNK